jgi:TrmH family RNA methyltransferase
MLTKNQIKLITQLKSKKYREQYELFVVEGVKSVLEFINAKQFELDQLYTTDASIFDTNQANLTVIDALILKKISNLKNPNTCLAVFKIKEAVVVEPKKGLQVALDTISDPGNLGTIIRLCDWFGVETLYCSKETVSCFNPKVVQATMGSLNRVQVVYTDLLKLLSSQDIPIYGAFMDGAHVYETTLNKDAIVLIGNEANGISNALEKLVSDRISIPKFAKTQETESLNAAVATGILLSEFRRR